MTTTEILDKEPKSGRQPTAAQGRAIGDDNRIGQSVCATCGESIRPGRGRGLARDIRDRFVSSKKRESYE